MTEQEQIDKIRSMTHKEQIEYLINMLDEKDKTITKLEMALNNNRRIAQTIELNQGACTAIYGWS